MGELIGFLIAAPFVALRDLMRLWMSWRRVPLQQKNMTRATGGAFVLVGCAVFAVHGFPVVGWKVTASVAAFALLYLVVGIVGARSPSAFDPMAVFWWGLLVVIAGGSLAVAFIGFPP